MKWLNLLAVLARTLEEISKWTWHVKLYFTRWKISFLMWLHGWSPNMVLIKCHQDCQAHLTLIVNIHMPVYIWVWIATLQLFVGMHWGHLTESWGSLAEGSATGIPIFLFCTAQIMFEGCGTIQPDTILPVGAFSCLKFNHFSWKLHFYHGQGKRQFMKSYMSCLKTWWQMKLLPGLCSEICFFFCE